MTASLQCSWWTRFWISKIPTSYLAAPRIVDVGEHSESSSEGTSSKEGGSVSPPQTIVRVMLVDMKLEIVQEMALAKEATVYCGDRFCHSNDFSDALALFQSRWFEVIDLLYERGPLNSVIGPWHPPGATSLFTISANVFSKGKEGKIL
jgi:hypothetical protein